MAPPIIAVSLSKLQRKNWTLNSLRSLVIVPTSTRLKLSGNGCAKRSPRITVTRPCVNSSLTAKPLSTLSTKTQSRLSNDYGPSSTSTQNSKNCWFQTNLSLAPKVNMNFVPMVIDQGDHWDRTYDVFSLLLK